LRFTFCFDTDVPENVGFGKKVRSTSLRVKN